jgi:putative membrane protein
LFWSSVLQPRAREAATGAPLASLFTTSVHTGALGALLVFASRPWYAPYLGTTGPYGFTPLEDQQLGGLIMWVPASLAYVGAGLAVAWSWLSSRDPRSPARSR